MPAMPKVDCHQHHTEFAAADLKAAVDFYTNKLGFTLAFMAGEPPAFAALNFGHVQIFLAKGEPKGAAGAFFLLGEPDASHGDPAPLDALYEFHRENGVEIAAPPTDQAYGIRDYSVRDLYGYYLTFGVRLMGGSGEPLKIERVDVPVRLEKRLAALLKDLAAHKAMSIDSALEEILLHTSEPLGDGVASPHTKRTLDYIQELKKKHGIDYDCHASYRFVE